MVIEWLGDPSVVSSLSPSSALQVTPAIFQSTEQEGRWKPQALVDKGSNSRYFELQKQLNNIKPSKVTLNEPYGEIHPFHQVLFDITVQPAGNNIIPAEIIDILTRLNPTGRPSLNQGSYARFDVNWWSDGLEIWSGVAGLSSKAYGFRHSWDDTCAVSFYAMPYGNYFPAKILIAWWGWINPICRKFLEFRGAMTICADGSTSDPLFKNTSGKSDPVYMEVWSRKKDDYEQILRCHDGFHLTIDSSLEYKF